MTVRVECPKCLSQCQVSQAHLGSMVRCGKCKHIFQTQKPESESSTHTEEEFEKISRSQESDEVSEQVSRENSPQSMKQETAWQSTAANKQEAIDPKAALKGLWSGLKGVYGSISASVSAAGKAATEPRTTKPKSEEPPTEEEEPQSEDSLSDIPLEFDGPGAERLEEADEKETPEKEPSLRQEPESLYGEFRLDIGRATSPGMQRERNEDSFLVMHQTWSNQETRQEMALIVVADGMGGYAAGDRASRILIDTFCQSFAPKIPEWMARTDSEMPEDVESHLMETIRLSGERIVEQGKSGTEQEGMGSTAVVAIIWNGRVLIAHVGDCRAYHFRDEELQQITKDHSLVNRMVELGTLSAEEAEDHPKSNEVTQAFGKHIEVEPTDFYRLNLNPGEWLVLSCDGLHAHVKPSQLQEILREKPATATLLTYYLIDLTNQLGGSDNCTVVAVRCY